jgi:hypothetical protein
MVARCETTTGEGANFDSRDAPDDRPTRDQSQRYNSDEHGQVYPHRLGELVRSCRDGSACARALLDVHHCAWLTGPIRDVDNDVRHHNTTRQKGQGKWVDISGERTCTAFSRHRNLMTCPRRRVAGRRVKIQSVASNVMWQWAVIIGAVSLFLYSLRARRVFSPTIYNPPHFWPWVSQDTSAAVGMQITQRSI